MKSLHSLRVQHGSRLAPWLLDLALPWAAPMQDARSAIMLNAVATDVLLLAWCLLAGWKWHC
jgi:hypothetical protein